MMIFSSIFCFFNHFLKINLLFSYHIPAFTRKARFKLIYMNLDLDYMKDKQLLLPLEVNIRGGVSSIIGDRDVEWDVIKQILYVDAKRLYGMQSVKIFLPVNSKHYRFRENTNKNILNRKT